MTLAEFEQGYAERSGMTVAKLHELGQHGEPCDCGEEGCHGWKMVSDLNKKLLADIERRKETP